MPEEFLASMSEARSEQNWKRVITEGADLTYVAEQAGVVVGFASAGPERAGRDGFAGELQAIYVLASAQGGGHGRQLVRAAVGGLRQLGLTDMLVWVLAGNPGARRFYEWLGGAYIRSQPITIGPVTLDEVAYGWRRLDDVRA